MTTKELLYIEASFRAMLKVWCTVPVGDSMVPWSPACRGCSSGPRRPGPDNPASAPQTAGPWTPFRPD